jgi:hypothetical protein
MSKLEEKKIQLLQKFVDGEASFFERSLVTLAAKYSLRIRAELSEVTDLSTKLQSYLKVDEFNSVNLWDRIGARIDQEQRASLFLGDRKERQSFSQWWVFPSGILAGGLAMALLMFTFGQLDSSVGTQVVSGASKIASQAPRGVELASVAEPSEGNVTLVKSQQQAAIRELEKEFYEKELAKELEVDWMRSAGRMRIIPDRADHLAVIVIQRPKRQVDNRGNIGLPVRTAPQAISVNSVNKR